MGTAPFPDPQQQWLRDAPRSIHGPHIKPQDFEGGKYRAQGCAIIGHCSAGAHEACWQADNAPPVGHDLDECRTAAPEGHRLRCRCACHEVTATDRYTADQMARFSWWQLRRIRTRRAQAVTDAHRQHHTLYRHQPAKPGPKPRKENPQ